MERIVRLARGGRRWPAQSSRVCLADGELETGAACRISSPLQAAVGSIFSPPPPARPPQLPWVRKEGGGCLVAELKVNVRRHNGEGPPPPHEGEARFSSPPHDYLRGAAPTINILQRSVWWVQRRHGGRAASSSRAFEVFPGIYKESGRPRSGLQRANTTRRPDSLSKLRVCSALSAPTCSPPTVFVQRRSSPWRTSTGSG